ncbi:MAG: L-2-hydroxyglutarate oxidase [Phycisphaerae bacterium]
MRQADILIIGGGIVGLATAYQLTRRHPDRTVIVLEKEDHLAPHQTGHNSGVLHSGIYYKPGSMKAINCRRGKAMMEQFCRDEGIDHDICGKVVVAVDEKELLALEGIFDRGQKNGVDCRMIEAEELRELEPHAAGIKAIHVPETGIVNYRQCCIRMAERVKEAGGDVVTGARVTAVNHETDAVVVVTTAGEFRAPYVINCAGLHSDRMTRLTTGQQPPVKIIPFRGEYYELKPDARHLVKNLIYPTPDPAFPFLGVHFTRMITRDEAGHHVECGPNAVLAFAREGYKLHHMNFGDIADTLTYPGFWKMSAKYWKTGMGEFLRSVSKAAFVKALQRLLPDIQAHHLEAAPAGVRAQALAPDGQLLDDFSVLETDRVVNVMNAPSPAATASLSVGDHIVDTLATRFEKRTAVAV